METIRAVLKTDPLRAKKQGKSCFFQWHSKWKK